MPQDPRQQSLDFAYPEAEGHSVSKRSLGSPPPSKARQAESDFLTVVHGDAYNSLRQIVSDKEKFEQRDDTPYPVACLPQAHGSVQLKPDLASEQPLLPAERAELSHKLFERVKRLSDLEADVLDIMTSRWLGLAKTINDRAILSVDEVILLRGITPKRGGAGRRGGFTREQRENHLRAVNVILDLWLTIEEVEIKGNRPIKRSLQSRPFVITDRLGDLRLFDGEIDVRTFIYVPGAVFAALLMACPQIALLPARALKYNPRTEWRQKRLTRYYSYLWGYRAAGGDYEKPLKISDIFREGLRSEIDPRSQLREMDCFVSCHRDLQNDGVIASWRYERQDGPWSERTIVVRPTDEIRRSYEEGPRAVPCFNLPAPSWIDEVGEAIRTRRESLGLSQRRLAKQLDISQASLSKAESGIGPVPEALRNWLRVS